VHTKYRPGIPCELQEVPNMNAPASQGDPARTIPGSGILPPLPKKANQQLAKRGEKQTNEILGYMARVHAGQPAVDPTIYRGSVYLKRMKDLGLKVTPQGHITTRKAGTP
jgi:hypothetical protein